MSDLYYAAVKPLLFRWLIALVRLVRDGLVLPVYPFVLFYFLIEEVRLEAAAFGPITLKYYL